MESCIKPVSGLLTATATTKILCKIPQNNGHKIPVIPSNVKNIAKLGEQELGGKLKTSWHDEYRDSAWIFIGGLPYDLTEGDVIAIFSQYGEVVQINLVRDKFTGKQKGYGFLCYEDQRSTDLAVDNFNGIKILSRTIRVDHVKDYKPPKGIEKLDDETKKLRKEGCAPKTA